MEQKELNSMIEQYKKSLLNMAKESALPVIQQLPMDAPLKPKANIENNIQASDSSFEHMPAEYANKEQTDNTKVAQEQEKIEEIIQFMPPEIDFIENEETNNAPAPTQPILTKAEDAEKKKEAYDLFLKYNTDMGKLKIHVFYATEVSPVQGAEIVVSKVFDGSRKEFYKLHTNNDGIVDNLSLPAPDRKDSQIYIKEMKPYETYDVTVSKPGLKKELFLDVPIFGGQKSIQRVFMAPKA